MICWPSGERREFIACSAFTQRALAISRWVSGVWTCSKRWRCIVSGCAWLWLGLVLQMSVIGILWVSCLASKQWRCIALVLHWFVDWQHSITKERNSALSVSVCPSSSLFPGCAEGSAYSLLTPNLSAAVIGWRNWLVDLQLPLHSTCPCVWLASFNLI